MATKAKKGTEQTFFDTFGEWSADDQAQALKTLTVIHDQTRRMERRMLMASGNKAEPELVKPVVTTPVWPCEFCGVDNYHTPGCPNEAK